MPSPRVFLSRFALLAIGAGLPLVAQTPAVIAYPQDTTGLLTSHVVPFGTWVFPTMQESRYQLLIPAERLPTRRSRVIGIEVVGDADLVLSYVRLQVRLAQTTATQLGDDFEANLPRPLVVLQHADSITWRRRVWTTLRFDRAFELDGRRSLVIEIQKETGAPGPTDFLSTASTGFFLRPDGLPAAVWTAGGVGSGASRAALASGVSPPIQLRLLVDTPTITLRSDPLNAATFGPGTPVGLAAYAPAGSCYCVIVDVGFGTPYELPGVLGFGRMRALAEFPLRDVPVGGRDEFTFTLPPNPDLIDTLFTLQAAFALPRGFASWSNATAFRVRTL